MSTCEPCAANDPIRFQKVAARDSIGAITPIQRKEIVYWWNVSNSDIGVSFPHLGECALTGSRIVRAAGVSTILIFSKNRSNNMAGKCRLR